MPVKLLEPFLAHGKHLDILSVTIIFIVVIFSVFIMLFCLTRMLFFKNQFKCCFFLECFLSSVEASTAF